MSFAIKLGVDTMYYTDEFYSLPAPVIVLTTSADDWALNDVVIDNLPVGAVIRAVKGVLLINTGRAEAGNKKLLGVQKIRIKKSTGAWDVDDLDLISLDTNMLMHSIYASGSVVLFGDNDVKAEVDGAGTYNLQWEDGKVGGSVVDFYGATVGLRVYWSLT